MKYSLAPPPFQPRRQLPNPECHRSSQVVLAASADLNRREPRRAGAPGGRGPVLVAPGSGYRSSYVVCTQPGL